MLLSLSSISLFLIITGLVMFVNLVGNNLEEIKSILKDIKSEIEQLELKIEQLELKADDWED